MPEYVLPGVNAAFNALDEFTQGYIECAFWCDASPDSEDMDGAGFSDLAPEALASMVQACADFQTENAELLSAYYECRAPSYAGHDLWLTRNHHGAGFWDRGLEANLSKLLTDAAHREGECSLYRGDDGLVYMYGG